MRWKWGDYWAGACFLIGLVVGTTASLDVGVLIVVAGVLAFPINALQQRAQSRPCPRCGGRVEVGELDCPRCEFNFRSIGP